LIFEIRDQKFFSLNNCKTIFYFLLISFFSLGFTYGQLSKIHYLPPFTDANNSNSIPNQQYIYLSTPSISNIQYIISPIGNPGSQVTGSFNNNNPIKYYVGNGRNTQLHVNKGESNTIKNNKGYIIQTSEPSYVSMRLRGGGNVQAGAIVSKGEAALGKTFRAGMSKNDETNNKEKKANFISVLATLDNTEVVFSNIEDGIKLNNMKSDGSVGVESPILPGFTKTIILNQGESYVMSANINLNSSYRDALIGTLIESNKNIVVNVGSMNGSSHTSNGRDFLIDQIVPIERVGKEYIFVRADGTNPIENIIVVAHEDNTKIFLDGNIIEFASIDAGQYLNIEGQEYGANGTLYLSSSKPVYSYQIVGGNKGSGANVGMFFVPPLTCSVSGILDNIPFIKDVANLTFNGEVYVVTNNGSNILLTDDNNNENELGSLNIATVTSRDVTGADYTAYVFKNLSGNVKIVSDGELYASYANVNGAATSGGFYAGFNSDPQLDLERPNIAGELCLPNVIINANGVLTLDSFSWWYDDLSGIGFVDLIDDSNPFSPLNPGKYKLIGQLQCGVNPIEYYESNEVTVSNCPEDFDGDGINDNIDLDLDNDGILNSYESKGEVTLNLTDFSNPLMVFKDLSTSTSPTINISLSGSSSITSNATGNVSSTVVSGDVSNTLNINFNTEVNVVITPILSSSKNIINNEYFSIRSLNNEESFTLIDPDNQYLVDTNFDGIYESGVRLFSANEILFKYNAAPTGNTSGTFYLEKTNQIEIKHFNENSDLNSTLNYTISLSHYNLDTDADSSVDSYDLDSDSDGCFDVREAGFADGDQDGYLGEAPLVVDDRGIVTAQGGYARPLDGDLDGVDDFQQSETAVVIDLQPNDSYTCVNETVLFSIETSETEPLNYQWQKFAGGIWVDIAVDAIYTGVDSSTLSVTPNNTGFNGTIYRLKTWKNNYVCETYSNNAMLSVVAPNISFSALNLIIAESAADETIQLSLVTTPTSDVVIDISNPDTSEAIISPVKMIFTSENYDIPQDINIAPQQDDILDGDQTFDVIVSVNDIQTDNCYNDLADEKIEITVIDEDTADFFFDQPDNLTHENGETGYFRVRLTSKPVDNVYLSLNSDDLTEGTVSATIVFTPLNWNILQSVYVTGLQDPVPIHDGAIAYSIITGNVSSTDLNYNALDGSSLPDIPFINQDNNAPGITLEVVDSDTETDESGDTIEITFVLLSQPLGGANVSIPLSILGPAGEAEINTSSITILNENWNIPTQNKIVVTGLDDLLKDGDIPLTMVTGDPESTDPSYDNLVAEDVADVAFVNLDNDNAGITVSSISNNLSESGRSAFFDVVLESRPNTDVSISISAIDLSEVEIGMGYENIIFNNTNWNIPQKVYIKGVDDTDIDGDQSSIIQLKVKPGSDPLYTGISINKNVLTEDNDTATVILTGIDLLTSETGETGSFTIRLSSRPTSLVKVYFESDTLSEGIVDSSIIIEPDDWNVANLVTTIGVNDDPPKADGAQPFTVRIVKIESVDPNYNSIDLTILSDIEFINQDDDTPAILLKVFEDDYSTSEYGDSIKIGFRLVSKPFGSVTIPLSISQNPDEMVLEKNQIIIDIDDWEDFNQNTIIITGVDDSLLDGNQKVTFKTGNPSSSDSFYNGLDAKQIADLDLINIDNDVPEVLLSKPDVLSEDGTESILHISLSHEPSNEVVVYLELSDLTEVSTLFSRFIFNSTNWNQSQSFVLKGADDDLLDGDIISYLTLRIGIQTQDLNYLNIEEKRIELLTLDNEKDTDGDQVPDYSDNCPNLINADQRDLDGDGIGDMCDDDLDGDGVLNLIEESDSTNPENSCSFLFDSITEPVTAIPDCDSDGIGNDVDLDDDNDGILDVLESLLDFDNDGIPNSLDLDSDGDGCYDVLEAGYSDEDQDGVLGFSPIRTTTRGLVIYEGAYQSIPADFDNSGAYDFLEKNEEIQRIDPLIKQIKVKTGESIRLNIPYKEDYFFSWQVKKPDSDWQDINDNLIYSNSTTPELSIFDVKESMVGWFYRLVVRTKNFTCFKELYSLPIELVYDDFFIPNSFSPNGDGVNDLFEITGIGAYSKNKLTVYNRWEQKVYESENYINNWEGTSNLLGGNGSSSLPEGTYFYVFEEFIKGETYKGFIYIKR